ncbi:T-complex protein 1 subunit zeta, partial [Sarcoptes scabiei]
MIKKNKNKSNQFETISIANLFFEDAVLSSPNRLTSTSVQNSFEAQQFVTNKRPRNGANHFASIQCLLLLIENLSFARIMDANFHSKQAFISKQIFVYTIGAISFSHISEIFFVN